MEKASGTLPGTSDGFDAPSIYPAGHMASPRVSVIVPSYNAAATIATSLTALERQTSSDFEVVVVDSGTDAAATLVASYFPWVRLVRREERTFAGHARNLGIDVVDGELLAFTDADCAAAPDWIERIVAAHEREHPVIGGVVANGNPESWAGWAYYLTEFHHWMPGSPEGFVDDVPGCCWSMKRSAYRRWGPFLEETYCSDSSFHWRMERDDLHPYLDPAILVEHLNPTSLREVLGHEVRHGRSFARVRATDRHWGRLHAAFRALGAPLLPGLLLSRMAIGLGRRRGPLGRLALAGPLVAAAVTAWSWGELQGYVDRARRRPRT